MTPQNDATAPGSFGARLWRPFQAALRTERGQALLEFAFVLPILLVFLLSLVDFGIALDHRQVIQHAVREGARGGAVGLSAPEIVDAVVEQSQGVLEAGDITVCYAAGPDGTPARFAGSVVRVEATYTHQFIVGRELLTGFGMDPDSLSIEMTPRGDARLETSALGGTEC